MLRVTTIPCLSDNYAYLLHDDTGGESIVIDPSDAQPVQAAVHDSGTRLAAILCTHHHHDHVGGTLALAQANPGLRIYGHAADRGRIPAQTDFLEHGDSLVCGGISVRALHVPGHTLGALAYVVADAVFTGDTLFMAGCGRLFEGTAAMMVRSLYDVLLPLGEAIHVYCGHEYTVSNLTFARAIEPDNPAVLQRLSQTRLLRTKGQPSMGTPLGEERATNPFLRCEERSVRQGVGASEGMSTVDVFAALRAAKDRFRPVAA